MTSPQRGDKLLEQVLRLPRLHEQTIPKEYLDYQNHMNVMYYTHVGNHAIKPFMERMHLLNTVFKPGERGVFALRQVINYLNELREGDQVAVHSGLVDYDSKRMHFIHYIVNLTHNKVASSDERLTIYVDMNTRRTIKFEPEVLAMLAEAKQYYQSLGWQPEISGAITLKKDAASES